MIKQLDDGSNLRTVNIGDTVTFTLTVTNQGNVDATNIELIDHIPQGLTLNDPNWTNNGDGTATLTNPIPLLPAAASTTVDISLAVDNDAPSGLLTNWAEIADAADGNGDPATDIDSTPDTDNTDLFITDDDATGDGLGGQDEDDHDRAQIEILAPGSFDLALIKQLDDGTNFDTVNIGDPVTFTLTVTNQGNVDATNIELIDHIPQGLTLNLSLIHI